jgi:hypothetical protein
LKAIAISQRGVGHRRAIDENGSTLGEDRVLPALATNRRMMRLYLRISTEINLKYLLPPNPHLRTVQEYLPPLVSTRSDPQNRRQCLLDENDTESDAGSENHETNQPAGQIGDACRGDHFKQKPAGHAPQGPAQGGVARGLRRPTCDALRESDQYSENRPADQPEKPWKPCGCPRWEIKGRQHRDQRQLGNVPDDNARVGRSAHDPWRGVSDFHLHMERCGRGCSPACLEVMYAYRIRAARRSVIRPYNVLDGREGDVLATRIAVDIELAS